MEFPLITSLKESAVFDANGHVDKIIIYPPFMDIGNLREQVASGNYYKYVREVVQMFGTQISEDDFRLQMFLELGLADCIERSMNWDHTQLKKKPKLSKNQEIIYQDLPNLPKSDYMKKRFILGDGLLLGDEDILVSNQKYLECISEHLERFDDRDIANFLIWKMIESHLHSLHQNARSIKEKYQNKGKMNVSFL